LREVLARFSRLLFALLGFLLLISTLWQAILRRQPSDVAYFAFIHDHVIHLGFSDGSATRPYPLDMFIYGISYSPDGTWIAASVGKVRDHASALIRHDFARRTTRTLISNDSSFVNFPLVSPDGQYIAFMMGSRFTGTSSLYIVRSDGSELQPIATGFFANTDYAWLPDSRALIFIGTSATGEQKRLRYDLASAQVSIVDDKIFQAPYISTSGRYMVYEANRSGGVLLNVSDLWGENTRLLTQNTSEHQLRFDYSPIWSADEQWIYFSSFQVGSNGFDIYRIRPNGEGTMRLTKLVGDEYNPTLSSPISSQLHATRLLFLAFLCVLVSISTSRFH